MEKNFTKSSSPTSILKDCCCNVLNVISIFLCRRRRLELLENTSNGCCSLTSLRPFEKKEFVMGFNTRLDTFVEPCDVTSA